LNNKGPSSSGLDAELTIEVEPGPGRKHRIKVRYNSTFAPEFEILASPKPPVVSFSFLHPVEELRDASSQVGQFVRECCRVDNPLARTPRDKLYTAYKQWCFR
jgi:hypothetical protein